MMNYDEIPLNHVPVSKNATASEITVTIKDDEKTLKSKFLLYDDYRISFEDDTIKRCVAEALKSFDGEPSDIRIRINLSL